MEIDVKKNIEYGLNWLINSGIQSLDNNEVHGGFYAWYDVDRKRYSFIYSEITGFALNLLITLKDKINVDGLDKSIELATKYLVDSAFDKDFGAVKCRFILKRGWVNNYCTFDNAMIANGLINKFRIDGDKSALGVAEIILETIMTKLFLGNGFYSRFILSEKRYQNDDDKWSTGFGSFYAKIAIPFLNIYDLTKVDKYLNFTEKILDLTLKFQEPSGRFITHQKYNSTFLHPHCYTIEGLIAATSYMKKETYALAVKKALNWIHCLKLENGGLAGLIYENETIKMDSPDINSQYLRCMLIFENAYTESKEIFKLLNRILSYQITDSKDHRIKGGFRIGDIWFYDQTKQRMGQIRNHINTWATIFVLNALYYLQYQENNPFKLC